LLAGDVLLHCVVDAILGALGLPDIGQIFPDSDPKWKGAASSVFIKEAVSFYILVMTIS
jgi:2-C-methyl-D-erythritol 2,4-cyclodiphosphate synthase